MIYRKGAEEEKGKTISRPSVERERKKYYRAVVNVDTDVPVIYYPAPSAFASNGLCQPLPVRTSGPLAPANELLDSAPESPPVDQGNPNDRYLPDSVGNGRARRVFARQRQRPAARDPEH
jgi:hypothetical protein